MPAPSSCASNDSGRSFFDHPRPAPSTPSSRSARSTPEGLVIPPIPPTNDPLVVTLDTHGHRVFLRVSDAPLQVDSSHVRRLVQFNAAPVPKCANCAELAIDCSFVEAGIPCPPCAILGIPDCDWTNPYWFAQNLRHCRDAYIRHERDSLVTAVREDHLAPSLFEREFERVQVWFYASAQGAITRFLLNARATRDLAVRGYGALANASTDVAHLLRFLAIATESRMHPLTLQIVANRVQTIIASMMS
ncbi:hypothetical protein DFH08DRAFT_966314 [Mycena albidolilacea]|uniref:Uncharacterized protein n=1 Tax=Mycena albidolilacea TaxID=1033008 RepID=A0AAD6ZPK9_9AGAR|nr:hypothetical protein DFH08DRAFT_966314 [Mycena albidolilacea]